jgi:hypothetical protein
MYKSYLKLFGYKGLIDSNDTNKVTIDIRNGSVRSINDKQKRKWYEGDKMRKFINTTYHILIGLLLAWIPIYTIIMSIMDSDIKYITSNIFSYLFLVQYILGIQYYNKKHIYEIYGTENNINKIDKYYIYGIIIGLITTITMLVLLIISIDNTIYNDIYNGSLVQKIFVCILLVCENFFSHNCFMFNIINFSFVFYNYGKNIQTFYDQLVQKLNQAEKISVISIITDYQELKNNYAKSVILWNNIFSSVLSLGIFGIYFSAMSFSVEYISFTHIINSLYVLFTSILYLYTINKVQNVVQDIQRYINSPQFINTYKNDTIDNDIELGDADDNDQIKNLITKVMISSTYNNFSNEWQILNNILNQKWFNFTIFGFEIDNADLIKKASAILISLLMALNIKERIGI